MIGTLITSQTRVKLLKKFFLNSSTKAHLRGLEAEFGDSTNSIRVELNRLLDAGLLVSSQVSNRIIYQANIFHPLFGDIHNIILKETGIDQIIEKIASRVGDQISLYLIGDFAHGIDSNIIELILVGENLDRVFLTKKIGQAEKYIGRRINCIILDPILASAILKNYGASDLLPLWNCKTQEAQ